MRKTPAQKIRDYFIKKYGISKDIFIAGETEDSIRMSEMQRKNKKK